MFLPIYNSLTRLGVERVKPWSSAGIDLALGRREPLLDPQFYMWGVALRIILLAQVLYLALGLGLGLDNFLFMLEK